MNTSKLFQSAWNTLQIPGKPRNKQIEAINSILDGHYILLVAPTSFGKSAVYLVPAIINGSKGKWTLVIEPTLALIADQVNKLQELGINAEMMTSRNRSKHDDILDRLCKNEIAILYVTPERLQSEEFCSAVADNPPWFIAVDEAHCVLDWGYTFRKDYLHIKDFTKNLPNNPAIAAFTATAPSKYRNRICKLLGMKKPEICTSSLARDNYPAERRLYWSGHQKAPVPCEVQYQEIR